jgi:TonB family protein
MKHLLFAAAIIASAILVTGAVVHPTEDQPNVVKAVAPSAYPFAGIAKKMWAEGTVIVEVKINAAGDVTAAKSLEGHELLKAVSVEAARQWKFVAGVDGRSVHLMFTFRMGSTDKETISFIGPYEIQFIGTLPRGC